LRAKAAALAGFMALRRMWVVGASLGKAQPPNEITFFTPVMALNFLNCSSTPLVLTVKSSLIYPNAKWMIVIGSPTCITSICTLYY
jgi:hypothetical protein